MKKSVECKVESLNNSKAKQSVKNLDERSILDALNSISEMMRDAGLEPKKQLGQNFLFDLNLTGRIARSVPDIENTTVIEVGPGPGGLTRALLMAGAKHVIAIEKDKAAAPILEKIAAASDGRLKVIFGDALRFSSFGDVMGGAGLSQTCLA